MSLAVVRAAWRVFYNADASNAAAAVSYYSIFAIAPLVFITLTVMDIFFERSLVISFLNSVGAVFGSGSVTLVETATINVAAAANAFWIPLVGVVFFLVMIIAFCNSLTAGLHRLWGIPHQGIRGWLRKSKNAVLFLCALEVYLAVILAARILFVHEGSGFLADVITTGVFITTTTVLFSLAYFILPWPKVSLRSRLIGAGVAGTMLSVVKVLVEWYLHISPFPGLYEAAGVILVILMWVYAASCVFFYGAAVVRVLEEPVFSMECEG